MPGYLCARVPVCPGAREPVFPGARVTMPGYLRARVPKYLSAGVPVPEYLSARKDLIKFRLKQAVKLVIYPWNQEEGSPGYKSSDIIENYTYDV
ncbi:hypothetical protein E2562_032587 [Oryza meyeriana var. granulata]|uniref:Uncharacterized protein n=1 Tax=Oryza meyeriana var. granulata TaxID=110450 RepID=A0A6G1EEH8_9ORYZ|nr:hypothetical protein E2562_032587 [Oryza meyeriana var. granulata]